MKTNEIYNVITNETMTEEEKIDLLESEEEELLLDTIYSLFEPHTGPAVDYHCIGDYENAIKALTDWNMEDGTDGKTAEEEAKKCLKDVSGTWLVPTAGGATAYGSIYEALIGDDWSSTDPVADVLEEIETRTNF